MLNEGSASSIPAWMARVLKPEAEQKPAVIAKKTTLFADTGTRVDVWYLAPNPDVMKGEGDDALELATGPKLGKP
eukprot:6709033-Alexandrium_andersonii.AAC.1